MKATCLAAFLLLSSTAGQTIDFESTGVPEGEDMHQVVSSKQAVLDGKNYTIDFHTVLRSGDMLPLLGSNDTVMWPFGLAVDVDGHPIYLENEDGTPSVSPDISNHPDFVSYLTPEGTDSIFQITHFESPRPASMYITELKQNTTTCGLTAVALAPIDFSSLNGLWIPCAGSITPWGTHLGSEEYEPDARALEEAELVEDVSEDITQYMRYFGFYASELGNDTSIIKENFNPYNYGYITEIGVDATGNVTVGKHPALGRLAYEMALIMPDNKTVYAGDDGAMVMSTVFVADKAGDLSAGTLYAAKYTQIDATAGGTFDIEWISLGHAKASDILAAIDKTKFSDLFDTEDVVDNGCPTAGFTLINAGEYGSQCLKVKKGKDMLASRLETRRYGAIKGATTEFNKWEGITLDKKTMTLHWAISTVAKGMEDMKMSDDNTTEFDIATANHIKLEANACGCVYTAKLVEEDGWWQAKQAVSQYCGVESEDDPSGCTVDTFANPDNMEIALDRLLVAEDGSHTNNMMWSLPLNKDSEDQEFKRVLTTPYGAEITGVQWYENLNNCAYLIASVQHPYDGKDELAKELAATGYEGYTGYIGPFVLEE